MTVNTSLPKVDAHAKAYGKAQYIADYYNETMLCAKVLHSTVTNGLVKSIDTKKALALEGVVLIRTCFDVPQKPFITAGHPLIDGKEHDIADRLLLNRRVRYYGDDIAAVVAIDEKTAIKALSLIDVEYEQYQPFFTYEQAISSPALHKQFADNTLGKTQINIGDFAKAAAAEKDLIIIEGSYSTQPVQACPIERAASLCYLDGEVLVVETTTQIPHILKRLIKKALGLPNQQIRVIKPHLGGSFGMGQDALYQPLNAYLSLELGGKPVFLELSRQESLWNTRTRHAMDFFITSACRADGSLVARKIIVHCNNGAYASQGHGVIGNGTDCLYKLYPAEKATELLTETYYSTLPTAGSMRGYGICQAAYALEAHTDSIARRLQIDPIALRKKQLSKQMIVEADGQPVKSNELIQCLDKGSAAFAWQKRRKSAGLVSGHKVRGSGMAVCYFHSGVYPVLPEMSAVKLHINTDGRVQIFSSIVDFGQGADTVLVQMASETLGIAEEKISIIARRDTDNNPYDNGAYASRQSFCTGWAIRTAAEQLRQKLDGLLAAGLPIPAGGLTEEADININKNAFSFGTSFAEIEVDLQTGVIEVLKIVNAHDCGVVINPQMAEGQVEGGIAMGIGFALSEHLKHDEQGRPQVFGLDNYLIPTALDLPDQEVIFADSFEPDAPYGNKSLGEPPLVTPAPAIRNALINALGIEINDLPLTPDRVLAAIQAR